MLSVDWSPGIGDPTWIGWITTVAYFVGVAMCIRAFRRARVNRRSSATSWLMLGIALVLLGLNKQLDLQILLTEIGRNVARQYDWYQQRRTIQEVFIAMLAATLTGVAVVVLIVSRRIRELRLSLIGVAVLLLFVLERAATFHHAPILPDSDWLNAALELGGIVLVAVGTLLE